MNKIADSVIISIIISIVICVLIPILGLIFAQKRYKSALKPFLLGALAFFVSQIVFRLPIIQYVLPSFGWYKSFASEHYFIYCAFLGLSAGIFEETARFIIFKFCFKKQLRYGDGISFGIGHGGIEVILITVVALFNTLACALAINSGTLSSLMGGAGQSDIDNVSFALYNLSEMAVFMGAAERLSAVAMHIGMTMIVVTGFFVKKPYLYLSFAILIHTVIDTVCGILPVLGIKGWALEGVLAIFAAALIAYTVWAKKHIFNKKEGIIQ